MKIKNSMKILAFLVAFVMITDNANAISYTTCDSLFKGGGLISGAFAAVSPTSTSAGTYVTLLGFSALIIATMLAILAMFYAIGRAFGISRLLSFVRTEYLETFLNFIILIFIAGGLAGVSSVVVFVSQLEGATVSTLSGTGAGITVAPVPSFSGISDLYTNICVAYYTDAFNQLINIVELSVQGLGYSLVYSLNVALMPAGFGIAFSPFAGYIILTSAMNVFVQVISVIILLEAAVIFLLGMVYNLFPLFLYAGLLLRTFPWTRAAGGVFLALFIAFYVFFPALVYPLTSLSIVVPTDFSALMGPIGGVFSGGLGGIVGTFSTDTSGGNSLFLISGIINYWTPAIIYGGFQIIGIIIAFVISFDLLEAVGDMLGAPSLNSKNLLKKIL